MPIPYSGPSQPHIAIFDQMVTETGGVVPQWKALTEGNEATKTGPVIMYVPSQAHQRPYIIVSIRNKEMVWLCACGVEGCAHKYVWTGRWLGHCPAKKSSPREG